MSTKAKSVKPVAVKSATVELEYVGGVSPVTLVMPTGRSVTVVRGEVVEFLASEAVGLEGRDDFKQPVAATAATINEETK